MKTRRRVVPFWVPLLFGLTSLSAEIGKPSLQAVRTVDIVQLLVTGMCLGAALVMFVWFLRDRRGDRAA